MRGTIFWKYNVTSKIGGGGMPLPFKLNVLNDVQVAISHLLPLQAQAYH